MEMVKLEDLKKMERRGVLYRDFSYGFITTEDIKKLEVIDAEPVRQWSVDDERR